MNFDIKEYESLPDSMTASELSELFTNLIAIAHQQPKISRDLIMDALYELANRQWHTYSLIHDDVKILIETWIINNFNSESLKFVENATSIAPMLGLTVVVVYFKKLLQGKLSPEVRKEIEGALQEYENCIANPYSGMPTNV